MTSASPALTPPTPRRRGLLWSALLAAVLASWVSFFYHQPTALNRVGIGHYRVEIAPAQFHEIWFLDLWAILAANDAVAAGQDPYLENRLDFMQRPHVYGPAWLYLRHLGLTRADVRWLGAALAAAFLAAATLFLRPADGRSTAWYLLIAASIPVLAAIERGNNDLVIFLLLAPVVPCLLAPRAAVRWLAVPLLALAAALKYYPVAAALILLAPGARSDVRRRLVAAALAFALVAWHVVASNPHPVVMPEPSGILTFGAVGSFSLLGWRGPGPQLAVLALALAVAVAWWRAPLLRDWRPAPDQQRAWLHFILAGTLLAGCFVVGQHYAYRWVFAIWLAPLLWILPRDPAAPAAVRRLARALAGLLLLQLWAEAGFVFLMHQRPHPEMVTLSRTLDLALQLPRWAFFLGLSGFIVHFVRLGWANLRTAR